MCLSPYEAMTSWSLKSLVQIVAFNSLVGMHELGD